MSKVYEYVVDRILRELENGRVPWRQEWLVKKYNYVTGRPYTGVNLILLPLAGGYLTPRQIERAGAKIKKGARSYMVVFRKPFWISPEGEIYTEKDFEGGRPNPEDVKSLDLEQRFALRYYRVFHEEDVEGLPPKKETAHADTEGANSYSKAEDVIASYPSPAPGIKEGCYSAYYVPSSDTICVPSRSAFGSLDSFYSVLFHEVIHSTGHPKRFNRFGTNSRPSRESYSFEELVAEIGANMLLSEIGLKVDWENSGAYVRGWIRYLSGAPKSTLIRAAAQAQKACDWLLAAAVKSKEEKEAA